MILTIARKEFIEMIRDGRFLCVGAVVFVLLVTAIAAGWKNYSDMRAERTSARRFNREQWINQGAKNPHTAGHFGTYVFKPSAPLSLLDSGITPYVGSAFYLEAHWQNDPQYRQIDDATPAGRFGEMTATTVVQTLLPLLIILVSFPAFAGEREQGTLKQLLSLGLDRKIIVLGKAAGIAFAVGALTAPAVILGMVALAFVSEPGASLDNSARMLLMAGGYLLYLGAFLGLSLAVSAVASSSRLALVIMLGFWALNSFMLPRAFSDLSKRLYPTPSAFEFHEGIYAEKGKGIDGHNTQDERLDNLKAELLKKYSVSRVEELPINFDGVALQVGEQYTGEIFDRYYGRLWDTYQQQNNFHRIGGLFAPMLALRSLSMGLAGTDFASHRHFAIAAEQHRRAVIKLLNEDLTLKSKTGDFSYFADSKLWEQIPELEYQIPTVAWALKNQIRSIVILLAWFSVSLAAALAIASKMRFDVVPVRQKC